MWLRCRGGKTRAWGFMKAAGPAGCSCICCDGNLNLAGQVEGQEGCRQAGGLTWQGLDMRICQEQRVNQCLAERAWLRASTDLLGLWQLQPPSLLATSHHALHWSQAPAGRWGHPH